MKTKTKKSSNGVHMEVHDANKVQGSMIDFKPHTLWRNGSGKWSFTFDVAFTFQLADGRVIRDDRRLSIGNITQRGRKPRA